MADKWVVTAKKADFKQIAQEFSIDPVIARLITNRDVVGNEAIEAYLHGGLDMLGDPMQMKDMEKAADLLLAGIGRGKKIRIIGDYDIDGVMSSFILESGLTHLGADADVRIPDRVKDGYGLNDNLVTEAIEDGIEMILTCDNGISAAKQIARAREQGIICIVTDHHEVPQKTNPDGTFDFVLPPAHAVVNPKQADCPYPFKGLCGAVVSWYLIRTLYRKHTGSEKEAMRFLPYAAIATIGDVMQMREENRMIVKEGLKMLKTMDNPGLLELIRQNGLEAEKIDEYHIGFVIGPCLNAGGRLDTAYQAFSLLKAENKEEAAKLAANLIALNQSRKALTAKGVEEAKELVENSSLKKDKVLVVYLPSCHESIAGIIAGRLKETYNKPSFVLTRTDQGVKGSGRSIEAYNMYEGLCRCEKLMTKFGGHPMAAGISLKEDQVDALRKMLNETCDLTEDDLVKKVRIDMAMPIGYISRELIQELNLLRPFGNGNEKPLFAQKNLTVRNLRILGQNRNFVKMQLVDETGCSIEGTYFGDADKFAADVSASDHIMITYYPKINSFRGTDTMQVSISNYL